MTRVTALIADDEPLLREALVRLLGERLARARDRRAGAQRPRSHRSVRSASPNVCFLDVQMPGKTGVEAAQHIGRRAHLVFVTAFDEYAVQAFAAGRARLPGQTRRAGTPRRNRVATEGAAARGTAGARYRGAAAAAGAGAQSGSAPQTLRWVRASVGSTVRLIAVQDIDFLRAEEKYTQIAWRDDTGQPREAVIRTALKELIPQLDASQFAQVHRSVVVNLSAISHVTRGANETADIHLKGRQETLPVSRTYLHLFRQM